MMPVDRNSKSASGIFTIPWGVEFAGLAGVISTSSSNLGTVRRRLVHPSRFKNWCLTSLQRRVAKTGGRLVKEARY